ncbi:MAG: ATP synthase F1 subunit epsilon [Saprospiraceae bacterium]|nr:ATP synthase F1 subunit epsilon [Saprospiraceae bacterium]
MKVNILTPDKSLYHGNAKSVILPGIGGQFEILDKHAPMIAALGKGIINLTDDKEEKTKIEIVRGFCEVLNNEINLLVRV